jgi:hypothetical protein
MESSCNGEHPIIASEDPKHKGRAASELSAVQIRRRCVHDVAVDARMNASQSERATRIAAPDKYRIFPPGWSHLYIPTSSRRAALTGLTLYASCKPGAIAAQRLAWTLVAAFGPRILPGRDQPWLPPMPAELWAELLERWRGDFGAFQSVAIYQRLQAQRTGLALLLIGVRAPVAFLKVQQGERAGLATEALALRKVEAFRPRSFHAPTLLGRGVLDAWSYLAMTPLPPRLHRPPRDPPLREITDEVSAALEGLPQVAATPAHWRPMHGDLTPWNLRSFRAQGLAIVDWEDAAWGPPHADEALYRASACALRRSSTPRGGVDRESVDFWERQIRGRDAARPRDAQLSSALLEALAAMRPQASETG